MDKNFLGFGVLADKAVVYTESLAGVRSVRAVGIQAVAGTARGEEPHSQNPELVLS